MSCCRSGIAAACLRADAAVDPCQRAGVPEWRSAVGPVVICAARPLASRRGAQQGRPELTILRPSVIFGADDRSIRLFARLQALALVMALAGWRARFQPVWVEDGCGPGAAPGSTGRRSAVRIACAGPRSARWRSRAPVRALERS